MAANLTVKINCRLIMTFLEKSYFALRKEEKRAFPGGKHASFEPDEL
jgi:hypothetical protein